MVVVIVGARYAACIRTDLDALIIDVRGSNAAHSSPPFGQPIPCGRDGQVGKEPARIRQLHPRTFATLTVQGSTSLHLARGGSVQPSELPFAGFYFLPNTSMSRLAEYYLVKA